ncbi:MAG: hypothetical protein SGI77_07945 [Pirellulaceae bacterium]|nr:hypothetical protein [Pirellulaceae bacterium]
MLKKSLTSILWIFASFMGSVVQAETTGWSWGPFASTTTKSTLGPQTTQPSSWTPHWKTPDVVGSMKRTTNSVTSATSKAWNSTVRTTKKTWKKTKEVLDPYPNNPQPNSSSSSTTKSSSWFGGSKKDDKPATVQDFLRQERIQ